MHRHRGTAVIVLTTLLLYHDTTALKASDLFHICNRNDPQLNNCVKEAIEQLRPKLKSGIPQLKMPSVDPMFIPKVRLVQGSGPVSIDSTFTDIYVTGITNFDIKQVTVDLDNYRVDLQMALPYLYLNSDYTIQGRILALPISGSGDSWSNYTVVTGTGSLIGHKESRDGKDYMKLDQFKFSVDVAHADIHLNNLFNGNKELGDAMNRFMRSNWEAVFKEMKPVVDEAITSILTDIARKVFDRFSLAELFPVG
uniref:Hemolymph juvenile hormone binding protein (JHBP) n=1 Tax=Coptotermes formosanus TaxID=36987 RepID=R4UK32_COPFO|nr:hemolymph juvenile hormone binding protein (JHBP) [Coptotermes formosanus]